MARKLEIQIIGDEKSAVRALNKTGAAAQGFGSKFAGVAGRVAKAAALVAGAAALGGLAVTLKVGADEWMQHAKVAAQTEAALKSTGNAANVTKGHIERLAEAQMLKTGVDDELIQSGQNLLLTFKNVRNEVGEGNKIFDRATVAALDLSQAGFGSIESASKMLGKALNDPVKGMTAMTRAGVTFSDSQKKAIKALVASGKSLEAQKLILKEVESQVGGSAAAYGKTLPGQLAILKQSFSNLAGELVGGLMPSLTKATGIASKFVSEFSQAKGWRAKLNIVWDGVQEAGQTITTKIGAAVAMIDWTAVWSRAQGIGEGLAARFESIDWTTVGTTIGNGIAEGVGKASEIGKKLADSVAASARTIDWTKLGRAMGPGVAAAMVTAFVTLLDPAFWAKNWDLALAVALAVFGRGITKLVAPLGRLFSKLGADAVQSILGGLEVNSPKLAAFLLAALTKLPAVVSKALSFLFAPVKSAFDRLGKIAQFAVKVLGIQAAIDGIGSFVSWVKDKFGELVRWIVGFQARAFAAAEDIGRSLVLGVVFGLSGLLGSVKDKIVGGVMGGIRAAGGFLHGSDDFHITKHLVGAPLAKGIIEGMDGGLALLAPKMQAKIKAAIDRAKAVVESARSRLQGSFGVLSEKLLRLFDAETGGTRTKSEGALDAIQARRRQEDIASAVASAEDALNRAREGGNAAEVADAERSLARAREDITIAGLETQAAAERKAYEDQREALRENLEKRLGTLTTHFEKEGATVKTALASIQKLMMQYGLSFMEAGDFVGKHFASGLAGAVGNAAGSAAGVKGARTGGDTYVTVNMPNYLGDKSEAAREIRQELLRIGGRNVGLAFE